MSARRKIIFFDIDGTLLNTGGAGQAALERALHDSFDVEFPFQGVLTAGRTDRGIVEEIFATHEVENTPLNRKRFRDCYLQHLPATLDSAPGRLLPGVSELLPKLAEDERIELAVLTGNYEASAWIKLRHYSVADYFAYGGFGDEHADRNSVAQTAVQAAITHQATHSENIDMLVIGDTVADITCARHIGARAAAVATGTFDQPSLQQHSPDLLFADLESTDDVVVGIQRALGL